MNQQTVYQTVSDNETYRVLKGSTHIINYVQPTTGYFFTPKQFEILIRESMYAAVKGIDFQTFYNQLTESK